MGKIFKYFCVFTLLLLLSRPPQAEASADDSAGSVLAARRTAWSDRKSSELISKNPIFTGELLTTNQVGRLQVLFHDDSILMMAPDTQTRITEYLYSSGADGNIGLDLARGVTRIISGKVTEEGGMINVSTPEASVGIRGTDVLCRYNPEGVLEVAVLQGSSNKPTTICLPGMLPTDCFELGHRQGMIISGSNANWMSRDTFNGFTGNNPNKDGGVKMAEYIPPAVTPGPNAPNNPVGPNGPGNPAKPPEVPGGMMTASYSGTFNHASGFSTGSLNAGFNFKISNLNTSPYVSSINFYATMDGGTYNYTAQGSGNLAPVSNNTDFTINTGNPNVTTEFTINGTPTGSPDSQINSSGGNLDWNVSGTGSYDAGFSGTPVRD